MFFFWWWLSKQPKILNVVAIYGCQWKQLKIQSKKHDINFLQKLINIVMRPYFLSCFFSVKIIIIHLNQIINNNNFSLSRITITNGNNLIFFYRFTTDIVFTCLCLSNAIIINIRWNNTIVLQSINVLIFFIYKKLFKFYIKLYIVSMFS